MMSLDIYIVMEWYPTDLEYQLNSPHFKLEEYSIRVVFYELLIGLQQIHVRTQMLLGIGCCRPACVHLRVACEQVIHQSCICRVGRSLTHPISHTPFRDRPFHVMLGELSQSSGVLHRDLKPVRRIQVAQPD